jgi:hypothetical protein
MRTILTASFCFAALCLSASIGAADEMRTIFILDATAQMSAKLGQQRKIDWVKSTITGAANRLEPSSSVALWAFGTNPAKKCEITGELVPLQRVDSGARAIEKAIAPLQPQAARAPAFGTVQSALASLGPSGDMPASVILIAGTGDDCTKDICSSATELHARYPNVKLTVLGIGMSEQAAVSFMCAAKALGGGFTAVKSGTDLDRTVRQALNITQGTVQPKAAAPVAASPNRTPATSENSAAAPDSGTGSAKVPASPAVQRPSPTATETKPVTPQQSQLEPNILLSAVPVAGGAPLEAGVTWEIYKITTTPTGQSRTADEASWTGGGGSAKLKLPEGRYMARAAYGYASGSSEFAVGGEKVEKIIPLDAGTIAAEALLTRETQAADGAFFILYRRKTAAALEELGRSSEVPALFQVNAGEYVLSAVAGLAKLDTVVKVEAGKVSSVRVALNVGILDLITFAAEGSQKPVPAWHQLYAATQEPGKSSAPLLRLAGAAHSVQLPAGSYRLQTTYGYTSQESIIQVEAGKVTSQTVILNAGEAKVSLPASSTGRVCAVYGAGADRNTNPIGRAAGNEMSFILKAGVYDLECINKGAATPAKQGQIRVVAGETQSARIDE